MPIPYTCGGLKLKEKYDVIVVGAGPAGSTAARIIAQGGLSVLLLEKRQEIGSPVRCAEAVSLEGLSRFVKPDPRWISAWINGGRIFSPDGTPVVVEQPGAGVVLERKVFDRHLVEMAVEDGAEVLVKAQVFDVIKENGFVRGVRFKHMGEVYEARSTILIAADGVESQVGRWAGLDTALRLDETEVCAQYLMANVEIEPEFCDFYLGHELAPRGYAWAFPKGERIANIGVGIGGTISSGDGKRALDYLNRFVRERFPNGSILSLVVGCVPVDGTLPKIVANGIMIVGDAAHQNDPLSGGGIVNAMIAAQIAGEVAVEAVKADDPSEEFLDRYPTKWEHEVGRTFKHLRRVREGVIRFSDETLNRCAHTLSKVPRGQLTVFQIFKTVLLNDPKLLFELRHLAGLGWFG
jgi:digeranylgeranylglycerophospholipid reductase